MSLWGSLMLNPSILVTAALANSACLPFQAEEAMATYRTCIADANTQKQELEDTKVTALRQLHEVVKQSDQVIKSVSLAGPSHQRRSALWSLKRSCKQACFGYV